MKESGNQETKQEFDFINEIKFSKNSQNYNFKKL